MMKILHLTSYVEKKNLGHPPYALHEMLLKSGHQSYIVAGKGDYFADNIYYIKASYFYEVLSLIYRWLFNKIIVINSKYGFMIEPNMNFQMFKSIKAVVDKEIDIIIVYWNKHHFNSRLIYKLSKYYSAKVVFQPLDMAHLTGGCHYSFGCNEFQKECRNCPAVSNLFKSLPYNEMKKKIKYLKKMNPALIAASTELMEQAKSSVIWSNSNIYKVYLPVYETYNGKNSSKFKDYIYKLGYSKDSKILVYPVSDAKNERKGMNIFLAVLKMLVFNQPSLMKEVLILFLGYNFDSYCLELDQLGVNFVNLGYVDQYKLKDIFLTSDIFVSTTIEDSGPVLINKGLVNGLCFISFNVGVAKDLVVDNFNGIIVKDNGSINEYYHGMLKILSMLNLEINEYKSNSILLSKSISNEKILNDYLRVFNSELY